MSSDFRVDQPSGAGTGTLNAARGDLWLGKPVNLVDPATSGSRTWTMLDKPAGSAASLGTPTNATSSWTPDVVGSYLFRLQRGSGPDDIREFVVRVTRSSLGVELPDLYLPAYRTCRTDSTYRRHTDGLLLMGD